MFIFISAPNDKSEKIKITCSPTDDIKELRDIISKEFGCKEYPPERQRLLFGGKQVNRTRNYAFFSMNCQVFVILMYLNSFSDTNIIFFIKIFIKMFSWKMDTLSFIIILSTIALSYSLENKKLKPLVKPNLQFYLWISL